MKAVFDEGVRDGDKGFIAAMIPAEHGALPEGFMPVIR
jgi:hypothetical protein